MFIKGKVSVYKREGVCLLKGRCMFSKEEVCVY